MPNRLAANTAWCGPMLALLVAGIPISAQTYTGRFLGHEAEITYSGRCDSSGTRTNVTNRTFSGAQATIAAESTPITCGVFSLRAAEFAFAAPNTALTVTRSSGEIATLTNPETLNLSARVNATARLLATLSGGRAATFTAEAYTLGTETTARTLPGCPSSNVRDSRPISQVSEVNMAASAQCGEFRTLRLGTHRVTQGTQLVEFDAYVTSAAQAAMGDVDLSGPVALLRNLSYSVRFRSVWRFTLSAPVTPTALRYPARRRQRANASSLNRRNPSRRRCATTYSVQKRTWRCVCWVRVDACSPHPMRNG